MKDSLKLRWLRAQGWDYGEAAKILEGPLYEPFPPRCTVCGQEWRPGKPEFIHVFGKACYLVPVNELETTDSIPCDKIVRHTTFWYAPDLHRVMDTGDNRDQIRPVCRDHGDQWPALCDCFTGQWIDLRKPRTFLQRLRQGMVLWTSTALRFVWGIIRDAALWGSFAVLHPRRYQRCRKVMKELGL